MKFLKNDEVQVLIGKDKGKKGKIEKVFTKEGKVLVTGVNQFKRHMKARSQTQQSEIVTITKPMQVSKVQLVCPKCKKLTRVGFQIEKDAKVRVCRKCGKEI